MDPAPEQLVPPAPADDLIEQLRAAMIDVMHGQRRQLELSAQAHGLTAQQAISLFKLGAADDIPMRELADRIGCDPSYITGIADRLEELGLLERRPAPEDRRVKLLVVTDRGHELREQLIAEVNSSAQGFSALSRDEQVELLDLLHRVSIAAEEAGVVERSLDD